MFFFIYVMFLSYVASEKKLDAVADDRMHLKIYENFAQNVLFLHQIFTNFLGRGLSPCPSAPLIPSFWICH